jgi:hypothetical protein
MRKRPALHCERLEQRELPANSLTSAILPMDVVRAAPMEASTPALQPLGLENQSQLQHRSSWDAGLSSDAVGAFFADRVALGGLFSDTNTDRLAPPTDDPVFESLPSPGWDTIPVHQGAKQGAPADDAEVWSFLHKYALKAIRREECARGPLPDHSDIVQQIYVEWREEVTVHDDVHARLLDRDSAERIAFRGAVRRVLDRSRYDAAKQRRRAEMTDQADAPSATSRDWADMEIDLAQGVGKLTGREREILDMRRWGATFEEIGSKFGLPKQRVFEVYSEVLDRLTTIYRD